MARAIDVDLALHTLSVYSANEMATGERTKDVAKGYDASAVKVGYMLGIKDALAVLYDMPTIEAEPVKHGKWVERKCEWFLYKCSLCDCGSDMETDYCPNCGARMDGN